MAPDITLLSVESSCLQVDSSVQTRVCLPLLIIHHWPQWPFGGFFFPILRQTHFAIFAAGFSSSWKKLPLVDNDLGDSPVFDIGHVHVALMTFQIHGIHSSYWGIFDVSYVSLCNLLDIHLRGKYTYTTWPASGNSLCFGKCSSQNQSKLYIKTRIRIGGPERVWNTQRVNPTSLYHPIPLRRFDGKMNAQRSTNSGNNRGNWPWDHGNLGGPGCGYLKTPKRHAEPGATEFPTWLELSRLII